MDDKNNNINDIDSISRESKSLLLKAENITLIKMKQAPRQAFVKKIKMPFLGSGEFHIEYLYKQISRNKQFIFVISIFLSFFNTFLYGQSKKNVLFIGNSLTYFDSKNNPEYPHNNRMPMILQNMLNETKKNINIDKVAFGGSTLTIHATYIGTDGSNEVFRRADEFETPSTVKKILSRNWDIVVLQENSASLVVPGIRMYSTKYALVWLDSIIKSKNGKTLLFQPYAGQYDPKIKRSHKTCLTIDSFGYILKEFAFYPNENIYIRQRDTIFCSDSFISSKQEFKEIELQCDKLAKGIDANVVKIGLAFEECKSIYPKINLYLNKHDDHPSEQGVYLIACMFYKALTHEKISNIKYSANLNKTEAKQIRLLVDNMR